MKLEKLGNINLYKGDCMNYMATCKDNEFDLAIVDPPYGIGQTWSKSRMDRFYKKGKLHSYKNNAIPKKEYFQKLFRISKNQIIWGGNYYTKFLHPTNSWIIWDKGKNEKSFMSEAEMAWTSFKTLLRLKKFQWDGARKCEKTIKIHPHQKPVKLYEWILHNYAKPGQKIFDSHFGSLSIGIACHNLGFELTACEMDEDYYSKAKKRLKIHQMQKTFRNEVKKSIDVKSTNQLNLF